MNAGRDYQKIAGDLLFGGDTLDNANRGLFLEAVIVHALLQHDADLGLDSRWIHAGIGWGPWDLQRGSAAQRNRVRVQVKAKAARQLWTRPENQRPAYDLGWKKTEISSKFAQDFPEEVYGLCEPQGHRCDLFLFAWHGPNLGPGDAHLGEPQSDPRNYYFFIVPSLARTVQRNILVRTLFAEFPRIDFLELPSALNAAADDFLVDDAANPQM